MKIQISIRFISLLIVLQLGLQSCVAPKSSNPQLGKDKLEDVIAALTIDEKIALIVGVGDGKTPPPGIPVYDPKSGISIEDNTFPKSASLFTPTVDGCVWGIPRLGIKSTVMGGITIAGTNPKDSTQEVRYTAFPSETSLAATWNTDLIEKVGEAIGNEVKESNVDIMLEPGLNIQRNPMCGRNFEYFSEDPLLSGKMAAAYVRGVQSQGVGTSIKHFAANNQETNRRSYNAIISQRALREIYLRGFEIAVKEGHPWSIMTSYNKFNGFYTAENPELLKIVTRQEWGFDGLFMTDWDGLGSAVAKVRAGSNLLMSGSKAEIDEIKAALKDKTLDEKEIDKSVEYVLKFKMKTPRSKGYKPSLKFDKVTHVALARESASEAMVLLKNSNTTLPFSANVKTVALFSKGSYFFVASGSGSGESKPIHSVTLNEGIKNAGFQVVKYLDDTYSNFVDTIFSNSSKVTDYFKRRIIPFHPELKISKADIAKQVAESDIAVIMIGRSGGEGHDNGYIPLDDVEQNLVRDVCEVYHAAGKKVVVILNVGGAFETASWRDLPDAILLAWQTGEQGGNAVADVLKGSVNPSGKLPVSFPIKYEDVPSAPNFTIEPESQKANINPVLYNEGIYVGYRYYDSFKVPVAFEFGYGLSYTTFEYSDLKLSSPTFTGKMKVNVIVKNTGKVPGKEVVQLYLAAPNTEIEKPVQELKGFAKTKLLQPGESQNLTFELDARSLASFWSGISAWVADKGIYEVRMGASSKDIRLKASFTLPEEMVAEKAHNVMYPYSLLNFELNELSVKTKK
ncbi:MAG: glycoside hydrolase family 3 C-terminal domain-containing protein [Bacteroidota bacterium]|nr:glycoside hydrolase family 3 C-terminal domain-containing protein [Bacteroidota bacterium]